MLLATIGLSVSVWPTTHADYERSVAAVRAQLDEATFAAAWAAGHALTLEQAIAEALEPLPELPAPAPAPPPPTAPTGAYPVGLTAREVEVLRLVAQGLTDAQVADMRICWQRRPIIV